MSRTRELTDSQRIKILEDEIQMMRGILVNQIHRIEEILGINNCCEIKSVTIINEN